MYSRFCVLLLRNKNVKLNTLLWSICHLCLLLLCRVGPVVIIYNKSVWECALTGYNHLPNSLNIRLRFTPKLPGSINCLTLNMVASYAYTFSNLVSDRQVYNISFNFRSWNIILFLCFCCFCFVFDRFILSSCYHFIVSCFILIMYNCAC